MKQPGRSPASGWRHIAFAEVGSTNVEVLERARAGDPGNLWITADRQVSGRGRRGRAWVSEPGNLYASALLIDPCPPARLGELPMVAVVAVQGAVARWLGARAGELSIKWPNDLLISGRKVSGILLESSRLADGRTAVAIGCGINCQHHPETTETPATDLASEGCSVIIDQLFRDLADELAIKLALWAAGDGFAEIRKLWLAQARGLSEPIRVRLVEGEMMGIFEAIDEMGRLVLATPDGRKHLISAGDVFFGGQAAAGGAR